MENSSVVLVEKSWIASLDNSGVVSSEPFVGFDGCSWVSPDENLSSVLASVGWKLVDSVNRFVS